MYSAITHGIRVTVEPIFLEDQSEPDAAHFVWAYQVTIHNESDEAVQLMRRHWIITDANGAVQEVEGPGVIGVQPVLEPGEVFEYTSGCPLSTASGFMHGTYAMRRSESGDMVDVRVPAFSLDSPHGGHSIH
ncbi:Co2+/Mg2+ efflux protein ApaG [Roseospira marina]|uniref:Protein ApaG n=1 Tax=Roseospira marina TaxID=140057 RepID=A0A5M6IC83_9PROT|nr:Co2+/Mg2+ efflux protein ApaG [Roseospira marina]KAA5605577.1 Co2+/Mg2+ efflux protein ApaG [Roseospira marina]MBB4313359.1 ApaG protein [Roseospira marina]MBB5085900.1 ApaG protein [Roseospira marina]